MTEEPIIDARFKRFIQRFELKKSMKMKRLNNSLIILYSALHILRANWPPYSGAI